MDVPDEGFLRSLYRQMDQMVLQPDDPRVVDLYSFPEAAGPDVIGELSREIAWSTSGSAFFLSGFRGSGKSTQLSRLGAQMRSRGYAAVRLESEDYLNLRTPVDVVEFLFFLVGGISDAIDDAGWLGRQTGAERGWRRLRDWLTALRRVSITPEVSAGFNLPVGVEVKASLKAELRSDESFVAQLRRFLDGRVSELVTEANKIVGDLVADVREHWKERTGEEWLGLVVMVDSLDHVRGADFAEVRRALVDLVDKQSRTITLEDCQTVFVVPPWVHIDFAAARKITNVKISTRGGQPYAPGIDALAEVVRRRVPGEDLVRAFGTDEQVLQNLIRDSGGHLRDLLRLIRSVAVAGDEVPFAPAAIERGRATVRDGLLPIADDDLACLRHVAKTQQLPLKSDAEWGSLALLFDRHLVLGYKNGEVWYGVHPLIADTID